MGLLGQRLSAVVGMIGGIIDMVVGVSLMQLEPVSTSAQSMKAPSLGYAVFALGIAVFGTGLYLLVTRMMQHRQHFGLLMILFGLVMLVLGLSMVGQIFMVAQVSLVSGILMLVVGLAMLYSGADMVRKRNIASTR